MIEAVVGRKQHCATVMMGSRRRLRRDLLFNVPFPISSCRQHRIFRRHGWTGELPRSRMAAAAGSRSGRRMLGDELPDHIRPSVLRAGDAIRLRWRLCRSPALITGASVFSQIALSSQNGDGDAGAYGARLRSSTHGIITGCSRAMLDGRAETTPGR